MRKSIVLVGLLGIVHAACSSAKSDANENGSTPTQDGGGGGGGDASPSSDGGTADLPKPVLCPETDFVSPKLPNSVYVGDVELKQDTTWTADKIYLVNDDLKIENHTLTVEAGTTICLSNKGKILVGQGIDPGEIHLNGTKEKPIVVTAFPSASDPTKPDAFHRGIQFDTYKDSTLSYVNVWYGGPGGGSASPAFELTSAGHGTDPKKPLLVDHLTVGAVQSRGVKVVNATGVAEGSSIQFTGYVTPDPSGPALGAVAELEISDITSFAKAFTFAGASIPDGAKYVGLTIAQTEGKIQKDTEIVDFGLPYVMKNQLVTEITGETSDPVGPTLTIREGVTMKMSGVVRVGGVGMGNLVVLGTADKPVTFTSAADTPAAGDWEGFYFAQAHFDPAKTKIDHAQILYAGVDTADPQQWNQSIGRCGSNFVGAVMVTANPLAAYDGPAITNTKIAHSKSDGIVTGASNTNGQCKTDYAAAAAAITFDDVAGQKVRDGACP